MYHEENAEEKCVSYNSDYKMQKIKATILLSKVILKSYLENNNFHLLK